MILGVRQPLVLSPMVDVTDAAFRHVAHDWGADITCSEMVAAAGLVHDNPHSWDLTTPYDGERPYGVQIMGGTPEQMAEAAHRITQRRRVDFIDINLGCPSPNILRSQAGGFLLRDPCKVGRVVEAVAEAVDVPVSIKLRKGHDEAHQTYLEVVDEAASAGAAWATLHGRTVVQGYSGNADWDAIARLVEHADIPIIGNGDLQTPQDVLRMREQTHCAGFFIARAAMHDPTVFRRMRAALDGEAVPPAPSLGVRIGALLSYLERAGDLHLAVLKRQATRFISGAPGAKRVRSAIHDAPDAAGVMAAVRSFEVAELDDEQARDQEERRVCHHGDQ